MDTEATTRPVGHPVGIKVVVIFTAARAALVFVGLLADLGVLSLDALAERSPIPLFASGTTVNVISRGLLAAIVVVSVLCIYGLVRRYEWGWTLSIVTAGIILALNIGWWASGDGHYTSMLMNSIVVFYLNQRDVRAIYHVGRE